MDRFKIIFCFFSILFLVACNDEKSSSTPTSAKTPTTAAKSDDKPVVKAAPKPQAPKKQYYTSSVFQFKVLQPPSWQIVENQMPNLPVIFVNRGNGGKESISVGADNKTYGNLTNYYDISRDFLLNSGQITSIVEETEGKTKAGIPFKRLIFEQSPQQGSLSSISFLYFQNKMGYSITCTAPKHVFDQQRTYYEEVAKTITF